MNYVTDKQRGRRNKRQTRYGSYSCLLPKRRIIAAVVILASFLLCACGGGPRSPLNKIRTEFADTPTYSIILDDMKEDGNFFKTYFHKYRIITDERTTDTGWMEVSKEYYQHNASFLGMTVWAKKDGTGGKAVGPPGYEYVGDPRYGQWRTNSSGRSFWDFYGQYAFISSLLGRGPIYRNNYDTYTISRTQGRAYYGSQKEYGTNGSITKKHKPNFYSRQTSKIRAKQASFSDRVNQRIGRTRTSARGRSGSWGK